MKRRQMLAGLGASAISSPWFFRSAQADQKEDKVPEPETVIAELLFVQSADSVELKNNLLTLSGINPATIFFADRPERIVGHEPTADFVAEWGEGQNSFNDNPPNAALSVLIGSEPQEVILTIMNPRLQKNKLIYDVKILDGNNSVTGDAASLFIDPVGRPLSPVSVAGVHRRHRRRRRRAIRSPGPR
jgi:hypothetical protein